MNHLDSDSFGRNFLIFHPSDFSDASFGAFAHALKIALQAKAKLEIMHVEPQIRPADVNKHWLEFPGVRSTLADWGVMPATARRQDVARTGLRVNKILAIHPDPVESILRYFARSKPDLLVLATHQREGLARWMHKPVAEPLARRSGAMTLFVPWQGPGFVDPSEGVVRLERVLVPMDHRPHPQIALDKASLLAQGLGCVDVEFILLHVGPPSAMPLVNRPEGPGWSFREVVRQGDAAQQILGEETDCQANLTVLATEGHADFLDALRGSTTERVVRGARSPVLAVPMQV